MEERDGSFGRFIPLLMSRHNFVNIFALKNPNKNFLSSCPNFTRHRVNLEEKLLLSEWFCQNLNRKMDNNFLKIRGKWGINKVPRTRPAYTNSIYFSTFILATLIISGGKQEKYMGIICLVAMWAFAL